MPSETLNSWTPGEVWLDTSGEPIQAHGGGILEVDGLYYWYGENKSAPTRVVPFVRHGADNKHYWHRTDLVGISCYSSADLMNWKNEGVVLAAVADDYQHDLYVENVLERPKVIFNEATGQFVMWMHIDTCEYQYARAGVAVADSPTGPFRYLGSLRPNGAMSRDLTLVKDHDGTAYLLHAAERNATLYASQLSSDYLEPTGSYTRNFVNQHREAPAVFAHSSGYYMVTSGCTGWDPNPAQLAYADTPAGPWQSLGDPCMGARADTTFDSQSTFILPVNEHACVFIANRWVKEDLGSSRHVWLPMLRDGERWRIEWKDRWDWSHLLEGRA